MSKKTEVNKDISKPDDNDHGSSALELSPKHQEKKDKMDDTKALKNKIKKKEAENRTLKKELDETKSEYLRQLADKENLRKRLEREKLEYYQHALSDALAEFLSVLDNFERALQSAVQDEEKSFREGVEMIYKQLLAVLAKQGVQPIEIQDKKFDPHVHQAFATQESADVQEPQVGEEYKKGYTLHGRLFRPSLVKVIVPKKEKD